MTALQLVIGNRRYSSWSLRGWLALRLAGLPVETEVIWLDEPGSKEALTAASPAATVPVLQLPEGALWDSLAIGLYAAESAPALWPSDPAERRLAYALTAEMHSAFAALRKALPMDFSRVGQPLAPEALAEPALAADLARFRAVWSRAKPGGFYFGEPGLIDCFYAPVASRFRSYAIDLPADAEAYCQTLLDWPLVREWEAEAALETRIIADP
ncbi:MAG: glutathione S-transferase N-terminal domain-containing protein [Pseudomonadota bacterium]